MVLSFLVFAFTETLGNVILCHTLSLRGSLELPLLFGVPLVHFLCHDVLLVVSVISLSGYSAKDGVHAQVVKGGFRFLDKSNDSHAWYGPIVTIIA